MAPDSASDNLWREIDPAALGARELGFLMTGLIVPRPIAWVSTVDAQGRANLAPHSYFNAVSSAPPILMFSSTHASRHRADQRKDSVVNIEQTGEFVVNLVSEHLLAAMNVTSAEVAPGVDEFELAGLDKAPSARVRPPGVAKARARLECRLERIIEVGDASVVFGEVVWFRASREIWRERTGRRDPPAADESPRRRPLHVARRRRAGRQADLGRRAQSSPWRG